MNPIAALRDVRSLPRAAARRTTQALFLLAPLAAFGRAQSGSADVTPPVYTVAPTITANSNLAAPLTARLQFTTNEPAKTEVSLRLGAELIRLHPEGGYKLVHDLPIAGMRPGTTWEIRVSARDAVGNRAVWPVPFTFTTPALPASFPPLHVTVSNPAAMEPGVTLFSTFFSSNSIPGTGAWVMMLDPQGRVVWYVRSRDRLQNVQRMRNGNLLALNASFEAQEIDLFGNVVRRWWAQGGGLANMPAGATLVALDQFHHEFQDLPSDELADFLCLSTGLRTYPNYPADEVNTQITSPSANVAGEVIAEINADGTIVRQVNLLDVLDPYRICYGSLAGYYNTVYGVTTLDWGHANSVTVDRSDDTWVISLRTQDCIVKVRRSDGSLVWIHGDPARWTAPWTSALLTPIGPNFGWQYHQHAARMDDFGVLTLFDNGNYRVIPPTPFGPTSGFYSRAVRYQIDPVNMTTEQVFEYRGATPFFSGFLGDADPFPGSGTILITDGAKQVPGMNKTFARLVEVDQQSPSNVVYEVIVNDPTVANNPYNWNIYRAQRLTAIYPSL